MKTLSKTEELVLSFLADTQRAFETRLKENDKKDEEFVKWGFVYKIGETAILDSLKLLEQKKLVYCKTMVHKFNSSEYCSKWQISDEGINLFKKQGCRILRNNSLNKDGKNNSNFGL